MKLGTLCYLPPRQFPGALAFHQNVTAYKTKYPVYLYSNDSSWGLHWGCDDPVRICDPRHPYFVSNAVFFSALWMARKLQLAFFFYMEADSRVKGDNWDERIFDEHFSLGDEILMSGSPVVWNPHQYTNASLLRLTDYAYDYKQRTGRPVCIYGYKQPHQLSDMAVYPNGSCAVYSTGFVEQALGVGENVLAHPSKHGPWDMVLGRAASNMFKEGVFDRVGGLRSVLSACTQVYWTEDDLKSKLMSGETAATHQIKSSWSPEM